MEKSFKGGGVLAKRKTASKGEGTANAKGSSRELHMFQKNRKEASLAGAGCTKGK